METIRPEAEPAEEQKNPLEAAQQRHERYIAAIALTACLLGLIVLAWRVLTIESVQGERMIVFASVLATYYFFALFDRRVVEWKRWLRTTLEVSAATFVIVLDSYAGPEFLFTTSATYIYMLTVVVSSFRLDTRISIYAASMAIVEQLSVYLYVFLFKGSRLAGSTPSFSSTRVFQELTFRSGILAILGVFGVLLTRTLRREIRKAAEEERVRSAFGSYVGRRVVERVLAGDLKIAPERRPITVMFVDIRNFTRLAETSDPAQLFEMLNGALDAFATAVQRQGGLVNKFLGDGLMAIFGAPENQDDHTRRAARAALQIREEAHARRDDGRFPGLQIGIGLHTGDALVGDIGGARREYTAIGDVVNVASRVEAANKEMGTEILITQSMKSALGRDAIVRPKSRVQLRGRSESIELFELQELEVNFAMSGEHKSFSSTIA